MINSVKINLIKNCIKLIETIQALTNTDIYSIVRIKKCSNLKLFLDDNFSESHKCWIKNNKCLEKDLLKLHNISYNHWIRSYLAKKITKDNIILKFSSYIGIIKNLISLILFFIKVKYSKIEFNRKIININNSDQEGDIKYRFISSQKSSRFKDIAMYLENNFNETIKYENIKFNYKFKILNSNVKDQNKNKVLKRVIKYCFKFPFMAKHYKQMFQGLYIYNYFIKNILEKNKFSLAKEIYSMETRSLSIASAEYKNETYVVAHNKFEALPYDMYSLNINKNPVYLESKLTAKKQKSPNIKDKAKYPSIVIQASDSCGSTISSYEFNSYKDIMYVLNKLNYNGEVIFKFHPANMNFFVSIKKDVCLYFLRSQNINLRFAHKNKNIEKYAFNCNFMISIDYSTSFLDILNMDIPIIYFNRNFDRHVINKSSKIYSFNNFKMISTKNELEETLMSLI